MYASNSKDPTDISQLKRKLAGVKLAGQKPPIQAATEPFKYLGVYFTMTLSWATQYQHAHATLREQLQRLGTSPTTTGQKIRILNTSIQPKLQYGFHLAPYNCKQVVDSLMCTFVKKAYGLKPYTPSAVAHEHIGQGGLGCPSIMVQYVTVKVQRLTCALNDTGTLGALSRSSVAFAQHIICTASIACTPTLITYSMRMRQLQAASRLNIQWLKRGKTAFKFQDMIPLNKEVSQMQHLIKMRDDGPGTILLRDVALLQAAGVSRLTDITRQDQHILATRGELETRFGISLDHAQKRALSRVSRWLHVGPANMSYKDYTSPSTGWKQGRQSIHHDVQRTIRYLHLACTSVSSTSPWSKYTTYCNTL